MLVLDELIVNTALPHIQRALHFSGTGLEWVVTGYAVTFGGLLLLGGRAGDILGRRRMFVAGIGLFTFASLAAGLATQPWLLIAARMLQGTGAAVAAPAALSLIAVTFPEGRLRTRALGVYAAMTGMGGGDRRDRRRPAHHVRVLALGVLRQRAGRPAARGRRPVRDPGVAALPPALGPARGGHRHGRVRAPHLRPDPGRHRPGRGFALGRPGHRGRAGRGRRHAGRVSASSRAGRRSRCCRCGSSRTGTGPVCT